MKIGYIEVGSLDRVAKSYWEFFEGWNMLITALNSNTNPTSILNWMEYIRTFPGAIVIRDGHVVVDSSVVRRLFKEQKTFSHYDEIFLFKDSPPSVPDRDYPFTPEWANFEDSIPQQFIHMCEKSNGSFRYLSDGQGLNFACESDDLALRLTETLQQTYGN